MKEGGEKLKKILFVITSLAVGGLEKVQVTLANKLSELGYEVTILLLEPVFDLQCQLNSKVQVRYKGYKKHIGEKIPYIRHKFYDDGMWETRMSAEKLHRYYIGSEHYDVEIGFFRGLPIKIVSGGEKREETKYLGWVHSDFRRTDSYKSNFRSKEAVYEAYKKLDKVICVSREAQIGFKNVIGDIGNLCTIYNMLSVNEIIQKSKQCPEIKVNKSKYHVVLVGRMVDKVKGQKRLVEVVVKLHEMGYKISLALIGGGVDEEKLKDEIIKKNATSYISVCGSQINPYPYIKEADLLVCASHYEGYNLTVAEALILDTPVLSTDCTGPNEILDYGKYGMIVENSTEGLYEGLKRFAENPELLLEYKKKTIERKKFFDEEKILDEITNLFEGK